MLETKHQVGRVVDRPVRSGGLGTAPVNVAFVMEQTLGHVTHFRNLQSAARSQDALRPTWLPIPFEVAGPGRFVPLLRSNWSVRASWRARQALNRVLHTTDIEVLVFHTQVTSLFSVGLMQRLPSLISLDATPLNYDSVGTHYGHRAAGNSFVDRQAFRMNQRAFQTAERLVAWSEWAKASLVQDYDVPASRVRVLAPGAAAAYFSVGERRGERFSPSAGRVKILFVGGDFIRKGGPLLLESLQGLLGDRCELHLVTGQDVPPQEGVHVYRGLTANSPGLLRLFEEADIFVLPTHADCLAVVLMEATAAALPVVTTSVGALGEAVESGETGVLVPPADGRALRTALLALIDDPDLRRRMGRTGNLLARRKFDAMRNNQALLDEVAALASSRRAARRTA